ncbi:mercuric resistance operon regulatory protein [bacterium BMS3Bbin11]|nr:mercuric resistance operon regulatory protein [bacterium BMS3Abin11]GBE46228.1 mercuric resistance operon regulatory protein [bacterium BMS3Bbin11]GMT39839.1 MAG: MerR family transcriptional regulator [bacterium]HDH17045.1 Hg(II)-responsive transcriptional regulator [Gammaproteobacteria bacterium]HDZ79613.1 Hg(II)-responsive transcriptional regulator [Gammaproteobacteria bacterium]
MNKPLTIGHIAQNAGVNVETIRYYQRIGILIEPAKPVEGYRIYPSDTVDRIRFIKRAQQLGFSLQEITELLELGDGHCDDVRHRAEEKRTIIDQQIKDLQNLQETLDTLIQACQCDGDTSHCPIVETLAGK